MTNKTMNNVTKIVKKVRKHMTEKLNNISTKVQ